MKALIYDGPGRLRISEVEAPQPESGEALVKVSHAGICGTDMHIYHGVHPRAKAPLIMGHEFSGTVVSMHGPPGGFEVGSRVVVEPLICCGECHACRSGAYHVCARLGLLGVDRAGGFAEYVSVPIRALHGIPDSVSFLEGALAEPVAVAVHSIRMSCMRAGDTAVVLGAGPIGTLVAEVCRASGAGEVIVADINGGRLETARGRGFTTCNPAERDLAEAVLGATGGKGADIVFDAAGAQRTATVSTKLVRIRGQIVVVAVYNTPPQVDYRDVNFKELNVIGVRVYNYEDFDIAIKMIGKRRLRIDGLATHVFGIDEAEKGFAVMEKSEGLKIMIRIGE